MRNRYYATMLVVLLGLMGMQIACSHHPSDDTITKDIQSKIAADPDTKDSQVNVATQDGKVTLTGTDTSQAAQQKVEQIAHAETGVTAVDDQTAVQAPAAQAPAEAPPAAAPQEAAAPPPPPKPKPQPIIVPAGTVLAVRTTDALSSKTSQTGQTFSGTLAQSVKVGGKTALPAGADVSGTVVSAKAKGKIKGQGELTLQLLSIATGGEHYQIQTDVFTSTVKGKGKRTAATTGGGAAAGALIGGLAGGGKGAGIGALVGGGAGLAGGALTGNQQIEIPPESVLNFTLSAPLTIPPRGE
ncbi:MAG TPA: BON domain-containing protein [Terriglobia bacterium]|nr:BON domain-containing protein [Terriglobia bacterium]